MRFFPVHLFFVLVTFLIGCEKKEETVAIPQQTAVAQLATKTPAISLSPQLPEKLEQHPESVKFAPGALLPLIQRAQKELNELPPLEYSYDESPSKKKSLDKKPSKTSKDKKKKEQKKFHLNYDIVFAVVNTATQRIETVKFPRSQVGNARTATSSGGEFNFSWKTWNGCNTPFEIKKPAGYAVLALRCLIGNGKEVESLVYTPYTSDIDTKEMRDLGYKYLLGKMNQAQKELQTANVKSKAFPGELVSHVVPMPVAFRLALIEHIDPNFLNKDPVEHLVNKVLVIIAANQEVAYTTSKSKAGAYGQFQFIPKTYSSIVKRYPDAKLLPDFRDGMRDHLNAAKASLLLFDSDLARPSKALRRSLRNNPDDLMLYLAAAYNGGSGVATKAIESAGTEWRSLLRKETRKYLEVIEAVNKVIAPI